LKDLVQNEIETPDGVAILEQIYVTELGYIMVRLYYRDRKVWINKQVSTLDELLIDTNFKRTDKFTIKRF
jgi:hypothetical protein